MPVRAELKPTGPYSLRLSGRLASDATRVVADGLYRAVIRVDGRIERGLAYARQENRHDRLRFGIGIDLDRSAACLDDGNCVDESKAELLCVRVAGSAHGDRDRDTGILGSDRQDASGRLGAARMASSKSCRPCFEIRESNSTTS